MSLSIIASVPIYRANKSKSLQRKHTGLPEGEMDDAAAARMRINRGRDEVPATVAQRVQKASDAPAYSGS